jgi:hypothetical protein
METDAFREIVTRARTLIVHVERHLDAFSDNDDLADLGRAWVRAVQLERALASVLPPEDVRDIDFELHADTCNAGPTGTSSDSRSTPEAPRENPSGRAAP